MRILDLPLSGLSKHKRKTEETKRTYRLRKRGASDWSKWVTSNRKKLTRGGRDIEIAPF